MTITDESTITDEEITLIWEIQLGGPPRAADLAVIRRLGSTVGILGDYIWDHVLGEPDFLPVGEVKDNIISMITEARSGR